MYEKLIKIVGATILICLACVTTNAELLLKRSAKSLNEALPVRVVHLYNYWPNEVDISNPNRVSGDENRHTDWAKRSSIDWIKKVVHSEWLPNKAEYLEENLIMIRNEFGEFDITHIQWTKNEYSIKISQTAGIIMIKLLPLANTDMGKTTEEKMQFTKELSSLIFNNTGMR